MIVKFISSETGQMIMFADVAHALLELVGKECTAQGVFTPAEMLPAAALLRQAAGADPHDAAAAAEQPTAADDEPREVKLSLAKRAWPLINMLERTARNGDDEASVVWQAPQDF